MSDAIEIAPLIGIKRHRFSVDGKGVTTLVGFHGCTLNCKYCLNPQCLSPNGIRYTVTPSQLLEEVKKDDLYFMATGGGITFGGGEPVIRSRFIEDFCKKAPQDWRITLETSLNVDRAHLERLFPFIHEYIIDIKDMNPIIYKKYTGEDNIRVIDNLKWLLKQELIANRIIVKLPYIPYYNTVDDIHNSRLFLNSLGVFYIKELQYKLPEQINEMRTKL